jgi:hypothetical protein
MSIGVHKGLLQDKIFKQIYEKPVLGSYGLSGRKQTNELDKKELVMVFAVVRRGSWEMK